MNRTYRSIFASRTDITEWLVHFTRRQSVDLGALEALRSILIEGALRPGFSVRSRGRTVYGPNPAVCFSEQPIKAVNAYVQARQNPYAADAFGLLLHKHSAFAAGAMPVIYGLANVTEAPDVAAHGCETGTRLLQPECLPINEQYRYVTFHANGSPGDMDWSHEREWRWPANAVQYGKATKLFLLGAREAFGRGAYQPRVHAFVSNTSTLEWLQNQVSTAHKQGQTGVFQELDLAEEYFAKNYPSLWSQELSNVRVITLDKVKKLGINRFEDFPEAEKVPLLL